MVKTMLVNGKTNKLKALKHWLKFQIFLCIRVTHLVSGNNISKKCFLEEGVKVLLLVV
jgi:hypothetical protein